MNISNCVHIVYDETQEYSYDLDRCLSLKTKKRQEKVKNYCLYGAYVGEEDMNGHEIASNDPDNYGGNTVDNADPDDCVWYAMGSTPGDDSERDDYRLMYHEEMERNAYFYDTLHDGDKIQRGMAHF